MQGRDDVAGFIADFAGDDRYIVDYLVEEVLKRESEAVRDFLLQTSHSRSAQRSTVRRRDRRAPGSARPCWRRSSDATCSWFRSTTDGAGIATTTSLPTCSSARLVDEQPDLVPTLHSRASAWYADNGEPSDAIRHALAARRLRHARQTWSSGTRRPCSETVRKPTLLGWLKALPEELLRDRPVLSDHLRRGVAVDRSLRRRRAAPATPSVARTGAASDPPDGEMVVADEEGFRRLPGTIAAHRAALALARGDLTRHRPTHARRALDLVAEDDHLWRGAGAAILGLASWASGDLEAAHRTYGEGMAQLATRRPHLRCPRLRHHPCRHPHRARSTARCQAYL